MRVEPLPIIQSCDGCGACCFHMVAPPFLAPGFEDGHDDRWDVLPQELKDGIRNFYESGARDKVPDDHPCLWLDRATRKCKHHEYRPDICREFERGSDGCLEWRNQVLRVIGLARVTMQGGENV